MPINAERIILLYLDLVGVLRGVEKPYIDRNEYYQSFFDASSVYGFEEIENSDLKLVVPRKRLKKIPWNNRIYGGIASIYYVDDKRYVKDPRFIAEKTVKYLENLGYKAYIGVEFEFFLFKSISVKIGYDKQLLRIIAPETHSNKYLLPPRHGYQVVDPIDEIQEVRHRIVKGIEKLGYRVIKSHHEVASSGQLEITLEHTEFLDACDAVVWVKYASKNIALRNGYVAIFLPKPLSSDNGSGLHIHVSLTNTRGDKCLFEDPDEEYGLSNLARYFIGGLLIHGRSLSALVSPTVNSYRRLIPGYGAPTILAWSVGNRSVAVRVPSSKKGVYRIEYRPPDPMMNPYLALSAIVLAGLDGIKNKIEPPQPLNENAYKYSVKELEKMGYKQLPRSLEEALDELENDHEYLKPVFSREVIESYIEVKRREAKKLQAIPTPSEYYYYMYW